MSSPLVSVVLPTYNGSKYLPSAISSVLAQSYKNIELIIVNDASTDPNVKKTILKFQDQDSRIRYLENTKNRERSASKNRGVYEAKWEFIAFIDDDDVWIDKNKLEKQMMVLLSDLTIWIVGTCAETINENNSEKDKILVKRIDFDIRNTILLTNQFVQSSVVIRKEIFKKSWGFNEYMNLCEDYDLWLRVGLYCKMANIRDEAVLYTIRTGGTTTKNLFRMKKLSIILAWTYRNSYSNFIISILVRVTTFFIPVGVISKIRKYIYN